MTYTYTLIRVYISAAIKRGYEMGFLNIILNEMTLRYCFYMSVNKAEKAYDGRNIRKERRKLLYYLHLYVFL